MTGAKSAALLSMVLLLCLLVAVSFAVKEAAPPPPGHDSSGPACPKKYRHCVTAGETCEKIRVSHKIAHKRFYQMNAQAFCGAALEVGDTICLQP